MTKRTDRLDSEFRREISAIVAGPLKDRAPGMKGIVSVTEVRVAPDLKTAKVYVSIYAASPEESKATFGLLCESAGFIRHELAAVMRMRTVPRLTVLADGSMEYGSKMDGIFAELYKEEQ